MPSAFPEWAQRVLEGFRPETPGFPGLADPKRIEWWNSMYNRFRKRWADIDAERWQIQASTSCSTDDVRAYVLKSAARCASEIGRARVPSKIVGAIREMRSLNGKISVAAANLAALLCQRDNIERENKVSDDYALDLDPLDFWDALYLSWQTASDDPELKEWASVVDEDLHKLLNNARTQSRTGISWQHVLCEIERRIAGSPLPYGMAEAGVFACTNTKATAWSPWARLLVERVDEGRFTMGLKFSPLDCLTPLQLATLAQVAFGASKQSINADQMRGHVRRHAARI